MLISQILSNSRSFANYSDNSSAHKIMSNASDSLGYLTNSSELRLQHQHLSSTSGIVDPLRRESPRVLRGIGEIKFNWGLQLMRENL